MITVPDEVILQTMQEVIDTFLIPKFVALGMNASGQWISSLEARVVNGRGEIWGRDYTYYLVNGRAPGKRPPIAPLISWVGHKFGLSGAAAISAAFAVAKKIEQEGTEYYPNGTDLLQVLTSPDVSTFVYNRYGVQIAAQARLQITRIIKNTLITAQWQY